MILRDGSCAWNTQERGVKALQPQPVIQIVISMKAFRSPFTMTSACSTKERGVKAIQPQFLKQVVVSVKALRDASFTLTSTTTKILRVDPSTVQKYGSCVWITK